jgi:Family of unknown function (DUF5996)
MTTSPHRSSPNVWLPLPIAAWQDTYETLHLWTQIIGKIRLALAPKINHWWHSTLYVTPRGLTTSTMFYGIRSLQITFDFLNHQLLNELPRRKRTGYQNQKRLSCSSRYSFR